MSGLHILLLHGGLAAYVASTALGALAVRRDDRRLLVGARIGLAAGLVLHAVLLAWIGIDQRRFPASSLSEVILFSSMILAAAALSLDLVRSTPVVTVAAAPLTTISVLFAAALAARATDRPPSDANFWVGVHVLVTLLAFVGFGMSFVFSILYLVARRQLKLQAAPSVLKMMPPLDRLYRMILSYASSGLTLLTLGILAGYLYGRSKFTQSNEWRLDPMILTTTATWLAYVALMAMSAVPACKGRRTAVGAIVCFVLVVATLWVSVFWSGFHNIL